METIAFIAAIGFVAYILLNISHILDEEHKGFKFILLSFVFFNLLLVFVNCG